MWCMLRGSVWIWMESSLFWFISEGQTHFSNSWHAKMSFTLNELHNMFFVQTSTLLHLSMHQILIEHGKFVSKSTNSRPKVMLSYKITLLRILKYSQLASSSTFTWKHSYLHVSGWAAGAGANQEQRTQSGQEEDAIDEKTQVLRAAMAHVVHSRRLLHFRKL